jgi:hypothetical protein
MRTILSWAAVCLLAALTYDAGAAVPVKKKAPAKKTSAAAAGNNKNKAPSKPAASAKTARGTKTPPRRPAVTWRNRQTQPTPERYKEIQQALTAKGYLQPEDATGTWTPTSTEALKRFQIEQNIEGSGKINSLSLIALGLGPKHDAPGAPAPRPPAAQ